MKPSPFELHRPRTTDEAVQLLAAANGEGKVLAGGQSLVPLMAFRLARPEVLVDLNSIPELTNLRTEGGELRVGAMVRQRALERSELVADGWPLLTEALPFVAHEPIRNRGTLAGSLAHADPAAELCAVGLVLEARLVARSVRGERELAIGEFFEGPFTTALEDDELLTEVVLPPVPAGSGWAFEEVARRRGDFAIAGVAALLALEKSGEVTVARLGYVSMGSTPCRAHAAERSLIGMPAEAGSFERAAQIASEELDPPRDLHASEGFRRHLAAVLTRRALARAHTRVEARSGSR
jgi:aerobic carbon-monoxide dehydrogenase medium subunit